MFFGEQKPFVNHRRTLVLSDSSAYHIGPGTPNLRQPSRRDSTALMDATMYSGHPWEKTSARIRGRLNWGPMLLRSKLALLVVVGVCYGDVPQEHIRLAAPVAAEHTKFLAGPGSHQTNRCSDLDMALFDKGKVCGSPLSQPCFDYSRCTSPHDGHGGGFYVHDLDCSLADSSELSVDGELDGEELGFRNSGWVWRRALKEAGLLAETYESACMFIHVSTRGAKPCPPSTPLWNDGVNHVMVDFSDSNRCADVAFVLSCRLSFVLNLVGK